MTELAESSTHTPRPGPFASALGATISFAVSVALVFARRPDAFTNPQFWAEDGRVFFVAARTEGASSLFEPYAGYLLLYSRAVAWLQQATHVPNAYAPHFYSAGWLLALLLVHVLIWLRTPFAPRLKALLAISMVLVPHRSEIFMNLTNSQWILALGIVVILTTRAVSVRGEVGAAFFLLVAGLTGPFITLFVPAIALALILQRKWDMRPHPVIISTAAVTAATQAVLLIQNGANRGDQSAPLRLELIGQFLADHLTVFFVADRIPNTSLILKGLLSFAVLAYASFALYRGRRDATSPFPFAAIACGAAIVATTALAFKGNLGSVSPSCCGVRYLYIPTVSLLWSIIIYTRSRAWIASTLAIWLSVLAIHRAPRDAFVDYQWANWAKQVGKAERLVIPINPPGWTMSVER